MPINCDEAIEYLPWLLNGSLEAGESGEVRRHLATCERCRAAWNDTRDAWTIFSQHLPSEALVALAYGEAPAGTDPALAERHLASCPECAAELELARTSRSLEDDKIAVFPGPRRKEAGIEGERRSWRAAALAAGLAGLVAATGWVYEFQKAGTLAQQLAWKPVPVEATRPAPAPVPGSGVSERQLAEVQSQLQQSRQIQEQLNQEMDQAKKQIADLSHEALQPQIIASVITVPAPQEVVRGQEKVIQIPRDQTVNLTLQTNDDSKASRRVEILDAGGRKLWSRDGLPQIDQEYQLNLPAGFLESGRYRIQLYAPGGHKAEAYAIQVQ